MIKNRYDERCFMRNNDYKGVFIAFDGPNGAGKSTLISLVEKTLIMRGYKVYVTSEPTATELGKYVRAFSEKHDGISLACMVTCDRYEHLKNEIIPMLEEGCIVITDRYVLSSLILQGMDGVDADFIMDINSEIIKPDLQIAVFADEKTLQKRLGDREILTRFEKDNQSEKELLFMKQGLDILRNIGVEIVETRNDNDLEKNVEEIADCIMQVRRSH